MRQVLGIIIACLSMVIFGGGMAIGWVLNVIHLFHASFDPITGRVVLMCVGVVMAPLGAVLGWVG